MAAAYAGIRICGLENDRAIVRRHTSNCWLSELRIAFANRDNQIGCGEVVRESKPAPFHQGLLYIIPGSRVCERSIRRDSCTRVDDYQHSFSSKNICGQNDFFLFLWRQQTQLRTARGQRQGSCSHARSASRDGCKSTPNLRVKWPIRFSSSTALILFRFAGCLRIRLSNFNQILRLRILNLCLRKRMRRRSVLRRAIHPQSSSSCPAVRRRQPSPS